MSRLAITFTFILLTLTAATGVRVWGQAFFPAGRQSNAGQLIEPPRALMQQLREAQRAAEQRQFSEAVVILGELLQRQPAGDDDDELSGQDFFIIESAPAEERGPVTLRKTLFGEARRALSEMPAAALETYELRYGPEARGLLEDAVARRDWSSVAEVRRRFFHSEAGRDATALLARRAISLGRPIEAIRLLEALESHPRASAETRAGAGTNMAALRRDLTAQTASSDAADADDAEPDLDDLFGNADVESPDADAAEAVAAQSAAADADAAAQGPPVRPSGGSVVIRGKATPLPPEAEFDAWLDERFGRSRARAASESQDVTMLGGTPSRDDRSEGQMPLSIADWVARTAEKASQERLLEESLESMISIGDVTPPAWMPLKVGDQVLMRSTERVYGLNFRSGKLTWQYPWFESSEKVEATDQMALLMDEDSGRNLLKQRVWNDLPYGRMTSDGKRVFLLHDLAEVEAASFHPLMGLQGTRPSGSAGNSLLALDLATEGKLVWTLGGSGDQSDGWSDTFFLGPPLPVDDALYVMAEVSGDIVLICLDAATGLERWRQQLLAIESAAVGTDPIRRVAGATPSYRDGILVCSTGAGAIIGFDLLDQSFAWAVTIERNEALTQNVMGRRDGFSPDQLLKRWWDGTPKIFGDTVYVTPIETDRLLAIDLLSGKLRFHEMPRSQSGTRYLAGIRDRVMVLVGSDLVRGYDAGTGQSLWKTPSGWLEAGEQVAGVGIFGQWRQSTAGPSKTAYFVPTSSNRVVAVAVDDGGVLASQTMQFPTGNLIMAEGKILSQSPTALAAAPGRRSLEASVAEALSSDPENFDAIVRQAKLLMERGELGEALRWLRRARSMDAEDIEVQNLSVRAMLNALQDDFPANVDLLPQLDDLIYHISDRVELIRLQVRAALDRDQPETAAAKLIQLSRLLIREPGLSSLGRTVADSSRHVTPDSWLAARMLQALHQADDDQQAAIHALVTQHLEQFADLPTAVLKRAAVHFGRLESARPLIEVLLDRYRDEENYLAMERLILGTAAATPGTVDRLSDWQRAALIESYARGGLSADASKLLQSGETDRLSEWVESLGLTEEHLAAITDTDRSFDWGKHVSVVLPQETIRGRPVPMRKPSVGETLRVVGETFRGWQLVSDDSTPFALRDPLGMLHPIPLQGRSRRDDISRRHAAFNGGMMIAVLPGELVGINLFEVLRGERDSVIWRRPWRSDSGGGVRGRTSRSTPFGDQVYSYGLGSGSDSEVHLGPIVGNTFYVLQGGELIAYDAMTAEPRWRNLETPRGGWIVCDGTSVAVVSPNSQVIVKYDCHDGRRLGEEPFEGYQLWAATDETVLCYREQDRNRRDIVLLNPLTGAELLRHRFEDLSRPVPTLPPSSNLRVMGRIVDGRYMATLANSGEVLIWDLENGKVISDVKLDEIPNLRQFHVIARHDSLVLLPNVDDSEEDRSSVALQTATGQDHVRVDGAVTAVSLETGKVLWRCPLEKEWGCTLTQSPVAPLLVLSRGKSRYLTTGSRTRTLDLLAIDTRDGTPIRTLDRPVESFSNEIETRVTLNPARGKMTVSVGLLNVEYEFSDEPAADADSDGGEKD